MSKCKAVLDSEKITEIRVKIKPQGENPQKDTMELKISDEIDRTLTTTSQQPE